MMTLCILIGIVCNLIGGLICSLLTGIVVSFICRLFGRFVRSCVGPEITPYDENTRRPFYRNRRRIENETNRRPRRRRVGRRYTIRNRRSEPCLPGEFYPNLFEYREYLIEFIEIILDQVLPVAFGFASGSVIVTVILSLFEGFFEDENDENDRACDCDCFDPNSFTGYDVGSEDNDESGNDGVVVCVFVGVVFVLCCIFGG